MTQFPVGGETDYSLVIPSLNGAFAIRNVQEHVHASIEGHTNACYTVRTHT